MIVLRRMNLAGLLLGTALLFTLTGCGGSGDNAGPTTASASSSSDGAKKLPQDLPRDVPVYDGKVYTVSDPEDGRWKFILETSDTKPEIAAGLKEAFSKDGWEIKTELDLGDSGGQIQADKGQLNVRVVYTANPVTRDKDTPTMMMSYDVEQTD